MHGSGSAGVRGICTSYLTFGLALRPTDGVPGGVIRGDPPVCLCQRRITHGQVSESGRPYMVYLLNSKYSRTQPKAWLCGGALISETVILTSAACLTEVTHMYAIAGYKKYVSSGNIDKDKCTRNRKQRIVEINVPKEFNKRHPNPEKWMKYDVGLAVVEEPYNFGDKSYIDDCSYTPKKISLFYTGNYEKPNTVALIFGWGGTRARKPGDRQDHNSEYLQEARTVITNISFCANYVNDDMKPVLNSGAMLCAFGTDFSRPNGNQRDLILENCLWRRFDLTNRDDLNLCNDKFEARRRMLSEKLSSQVNTNKTGRRIIDINNDAGGICENDHGGPLISFYGSSEVIIGIALTSVFTSNYECEGPYLYLNLRKIGSLIQCLQAESNETRRLCATLSSESKKITVNWPNHKSTKAQPGHREQALRNTKSQQSKRKPQKISEQTPKPTSKQTQKRTMKPIVYYTLRHPHLRMRVTLLSP